MRTSTPRIRSIITATLTVVILAAFAALLALPLQAQTTTVTLVSNAAEGNRSLISSDIHAQKFTTGPDVLGYFISTVELNLQNAAGRNIAVMLKENNSSNRPGNLLETLTNPAPLVSSSVNTFTVPNDRTLDPNTTYWITINEGVSGAKAEVRSRTQNTETSAYGWTIGNTRLFKSSLNSNWTSVASSFVQTGCPRHCTHRLHRRDAQRPDADARWRQRDHADAALCDWDEVLHGVGGEQREFDHADADGEQRQCHRRISRCERRVDHRHRHKHARVGRTVGGVRQHLQGEGDGRGREHQHGYLHSGGDAGGAGGRHPCAGQQHGAG